MACKGQLLDKVEKKEQARGKVPKVGQLSCDPIRYIVIIQMFGRKFRELLYSSYLWYFAGAGRAAGTSRRIDFAGA